MREPDGSLAMGHWAMKVLWRKQSGGAPPSTAVVIKGEDDGVGLGNRCRFLGRSLW